MRTGSNEIQNELNQTQASLENAKQQLKQFEEDERNATTKEAAIHAKRNQSDTEVGISFDKNKIKNLKKDLLAAKEREEELAHKKSLKDAQDRVAIRLKELYKLDSDYTKHANVLAKVLHNRKKLYEDIRGDTELLGENNIQVELPEHITRESKPIYNGVSTHSRNESYVEHITYNNPVQFTAVIPSIDGNGVIYSINKDINGLYLSRPANLYSASDILDGKYGAVMISSSKI